MENKINRFNQFIQHKALDFKFTSNNQQLTEMLMNDEEESKKWPVKNVCAKLVVPLVERLDSTLNTLSISKRQFIEYAIIEALDRADEIMNEVDIVEFLREEK